MANQLLEPGAAGPAGHDGPAVTRGASPAAPAVRDGNPRDEQHGNPNGIARRLVI